MYGPFEGDSYVDDLFADRVVSLIETHFRRSDHLDHSGLYASPPLFIFWAPHTAHSPLQVPAKSLAKIPTSPTFAHESKKVYSAMMYVSVGQLVVAVHICIRAFYLRKLQVDSFFYSVRRFHIDGHVGRIKQALEVAGVWNNTLIVWTSDNGGYASHLFFCSGYEKHAYAPSFVLNTMMLGLAHVMDCAHEGQCTTMAHRVLQIFHCVGGKCQTGMAGSVSLHLCRAGLCLPLIAVLRATFSVPSGTGVCYFCIVDSIAAGLGQQSTQYAPLRQVRNVRWAHWGGPYRHAR